MSPRPVPGRGSSAKLRLERGRYFELFSHDSGTTIVPGPRSFPASFVRQMLRLRFADTPARASENSRRGCFWRVLLRKSQVGRGVLSNRPATNHRLGVNPFSAKPFLIDSFAGCGVELASLPFCENACGCEGSLSSWKGSGVESTETSHKAPDGRSRQPPS